MTLNCNNATGCNIMTGALQLHNKNQQNFLISIIARQEKLAPTIGWVFFVFFLCLCLFNLCGCKGHGGRKGKSGHWVPLKSSQMKEGREESKGKERKNFHLLVCQQEILNGWRTKKSYRVVCWEMIHCTLTRSSEIWGMYTHSIVTTHKVFRVKQGIHFWSGKNSLPFPSMVMVIWRSYKVFRE